VTKRKILITGVAGSVGRAVWRRLIQNRNNDITGLDVRNWLLDKPSNFNFIQLDIKRNRAEDVFRRNRFHTVIHLSFIRDQAVSREKRHATNVIGTQQMLGYCAKYGVKKVLVVSRHMVYGAGPTNPSMITEDMPLKAAASWGQLSDLIEFDHVCRSWMYQQTKSHMVLLRPVFTMGPNVREGLLYRYLSLRRVPVLMGFSPMLQICHEDDVVEAIMCSLKPRARGIYNVTGSSSIPVARLVKELDLPHYPIPHPLLFATNDVAFRARLSPIPTGALNFLRYNCVVDGSKIRKELGYRPVRSLRETLEHFSRTHSTVIA